MPIQMEHNDGGKYVKILLIGTLVSEDYKPFVSQFAHLAQIYGKLRVLLDMTRFHGWDAGGLWQEIKFDLKHLDKLDRMAVVGEARWQHTIASFAKPLTPAEIRYFDGAQMTAAEDWLTGRETQSASGMSAA